MKNEAELCLGYVGRKVPRKVKPVEIDHMKKADPKTTLRVDSSSAEIEAL